MPTIRMEVEQYKTLLRRYIETQDEQSIYGAEQLSKSFIKNNILPEEIVHLHVQALKELYPGLSKAMERSMGLLLETMIFYGLAHQEYQSLKEKQSQLKSEISLAASMQNTLLETTKPNKIGRASC